jgi:hypothetical protein
VSGTNRANDLEAAFPRQVHVENDRVIRSRDRASFSGDAVMLDIDHVSRLAQPAAQNGRKSQIIFNDEKFHDVRGSNFLGKATKA